MGRRRCKLPIKTMVFFFIPSVVGVMNVASDITLNYILFFLIIILGTCLVALSSGYIAETLVKRDDVEKERMSYDEYITSYYHDSADDCGIYHS